MEDIISLGLESTMNTYSRFPLVLEKGEGAHVFGADGQKYLDFVAGIAANSLGHAHPKLVEALREQVGNLIHVSNLYWNKPAVELAARLVKNSPFDKAFFCNSGAEAIEGCLKLARINAAKSNSGRFEIVAMKNSFHGRTFAAVRATGQLKYQDGFAPHFPGVVHAQFNDLSSLEEAVTDKTCAILIEPVQGEGGIRPATKEFLEGARKLCDQYGISLIFDEVQCGVGRTGKFFAFEHFGVAPDAVALAKGLGGGVPIGAVLAVKDLAKAFEPGNHASTFGGNALSAAAGNVVTRELWENGLLERVAKTGEFLSQKLTRLKDKYPVVVDKRGIGLLQGIELSVPAAPVIAECIVNGLLLVNAGANVIRFVPPLIVSEDEISQGIEILERALAKI
jgi:predicted acetylornithine/succinylornithine family transaminase